MLRLSIGQLRPTEAETNEMWKAIYTASQKTKLLQDGYVMLLSLKNAKHSKGAAVYEGHSVPDRTIRSIVRSGPIV